MIAQKKINNLVEMINDNVTDGSIVSYTNSIIDDIQDGNFENKQVIIKFLQDLKQTQDYNIRKHCLIQALKHMKN